MRLEILQFFRSKLKLLMMLTMAFSAGLAHAQDIKVSGTITDAETGEALPGVTVLEKGTTNGTITDMNGQYVFNASSEDATLVFSFVGYAPQEATLQGRTVLDVSLAVDIQALEEVVVVGYGEQKKSLVTGAISSVKAKELNTVSYGRIDQALQGRTAGVNVQSSSGSPGAGTKIRIRGVGSSGNNDPLFIIDGVRTGAAGMDYLAPSDVESIEVLKDAAAAAIYGAAAANGVVIVTTKKGKSGKGEITYNMQMGAQSVNPKVNDMMMNAQQYVAYNQEAGTPNTPTTDDLKNVSGNGTNWMDQLFQSAPMQQHSLNFSGGTEKSTYFISGNIYKQDGIAGGKKSHFDRYTVRINSNHKVKDWLTVGENLSYSYIGKRGLTEDTEFGSLVGSAMSLDPTTPVTFSGALPAFAQTALNDGYNLIKAPNGQYYGLSPYVRGEYANPLEQIDLAKGRTTQNKVLGNAFVTVKPIKGLEVTSRFGIDAAFQRYHNWTPTFWYSSEKYNLLASGSDSWDEWFSWLWENFASYKKDFGDHHFNVLVGTAMQKKTHNYANGNYTGLFKEEDKWSYGAYVAPNTYTRFSSSPDGYQTLDSYYGRIGYDFGDKYLFNMTIRRDGSSLLAPGHRWGTFPSFSGGWVVSNEGFFPAALSNVISYFKLRGSWGRNGNINILSPGQWQSSISTNVGGLIRYPDATDNFLIGAAPTNLSNPELKWEVSQQTDFAADVRFFNDQLSLTVDYFKKLTKDQITPGTAPYFAGNSLPYFNSGVVQNKGWEFELTYRNAPNKALQFELSANMTTINNKVTQMNPNFPQISGSNVGTGWSGATYFSQGYPLWYFRGYKTDGIYQNQQQIDANKKDGYDPQPGDPIIQDTNGDGAITVDDMTYIGSPYPSAYYGVRAQASYKGFDLMVFLQGQFGNDILMGFNRTDRPTANKPAFFYEDRWTEEGSTNTWFRANSNNTFIYSSDLMVFKGNYARIRQLQIGYTIPAKLLEKMGVKNLRFYASLDNFFTFTKYPGIDPEAGSNNDNSQGIDRGVYPRPRKVIGGLSFSF